MKSYLNPRALLMLTAVAVALSLGLPVQGAGWSDSFNDGDVEDGDPVTWTWNEIGFTPGIYDASSGDFSMSNPGLSDGDFLVATVDETFGDTYVRSQSIILPDPNNPDNAGGNTGVVARLDPFSFSGYGLVVDRGQSIYLTRNDPGGIELPIIAGEMSAGFDPGEDLIVELNVIGDLLEGYFWRPGTEKPDTPAFSFPDPWGPSLPPGRAGIIYVEDNDNTIGVSRWATGRDVPIFEADYDFDGDVDGDDFLVWQAGYLVDDRGDTDYDGDTDGDDFLTWQSQYAPPPPSGNGSGAAAVPEPAGAVLAAALALVAGFAARRRRL